MDCLDDIMLSSYLDEALSKDERLKIEKHIVTCNKCLDILAVAHESRKKAKTPSLELKNKIKDKLGIKRKKRNDLPWMIAALVLFLLSFIVKRYFMQFLLAAVVMGFKWVMEGEGARRVVMIFKKIPEKEKKFERKSPPPVSNITGGGDKYDE
ncbi:MAG: zf-HC2 domain-containing protein [Candidatus Omnitrophota bacterium]